MTIFYGLLWHISRESMAGNNGKGCRCESTMTENRFEDAAMKTIDAWINERIKTCTYRNCKHNFVIVGERGFQK